MSCVYSMPAYIALTHCYISRSMSQGGTTERAKHRFYGEVQSLFMFCHEYNMFKPRRAYEWNSSSPSNTKMTRQNGTLYLRTFIWIDLNIFYFISHEERLSRAKMLCHSPLPSGLLSNAQDEAALHH